MTTKINGAAYPGVWVEKDTAFVRVTFGALMDAVVTANLLTLTGAAVTGTVTADSTFGVVESAVVQALKYIQSKATVLAVSSYDISSFSFDVMLGSAEGWFSDASGVIVAANGVALTGTVQAKVTAATAANVAVGDIVQLNLSAIGAGAAFGLQFLSFTGGLPVATASGGVQATLVTGPGYLPGSVTNPNGGSPGSGSSYTPITPKQVA